VSGTAAQIDVVVVTWNTRDVTISSLRHLTESVPDGLINLVVQDNASPDDTVPAIRAEFPAADVEAGATNVGFAAGVNLALRRTTAPWVLLLNSDAWPEPGALEQLVDCGERHPRAAAVAPRLLRPDGALEHSTWPIPSLRTAVSSALRAGRYAWPHDEERRVDWAVGAALLLRRAALADVGQLDESLFMYAEDLDWCWRARDAGWEIWFTPSAVVRHVGNVSGAQRYGDERSGAWINNSVRVYRKHSAWPATLAWRVVNAGGAALSARRARRRHQTEVAASWRRQVRQWLRPAYDDRLGTRR
jgi:GT2 family glycosyltransferase